MFNPHHLLSRSLLFLSPPSLCHPHRTLGESRRLSTSGGSGRGSRVVDGALTRGHPRVLPQAPLPRLWMWLASTGCTLISRSLPILRPASPVVVPVSSRLHVPTQSSCSRFQPRGSTSLPLLLSPESLTPPAFATGYPLQRTPQLLKVSLCPAHPASARAPGLWGRRPVHPSPSTLEADSLPTACVLCSPGFTSPRFPTLETCILFPMSKTQFCLTFAWLTFNKCSGLNLESYPQTKPSLTLKVNLRTR